LLYDVHFYNNRATGVVYGRVHQNILFFIEGQPETSTQHIDSLQYQQEQCAINAQILHVRDGLEHAAWPADVIL
jgi:hypothetical protein